MEVTLRGSLPGATTAGIFLLTRARQVGLPMRVSVVGDPETVAPIPGPAVVYAPVLASCGVGREHGSGATVVLPGPPGAPVLATVTPHGVGGWFEVDRQGKGCHPATQAYVRLSRDPRVPARKLGKRLRRAMKVLGLSTDPAVLDVLFGAQVPPLTRLSVALRAGRAISEGRGEPVTRFMATAFGAEHDPLPSDFDQAAFTATLEEGGLEWILDALSTSSRDHVEDFVERARKLAAEDGGRDLVLVWALAELASHLVQLPSQCMLPPLGAAEDSVAVGLKAALTAEGEGDAHAQLVQVYRFLGGKYVDDAQHAVDVVAEPEPEGRIARLQWFCSQVRQGRKDADNLWPNVVDPPQ